MMTNSRIEKHELLVGRATCFLVMCEFYCISLPQNNDHDHDDDIITLQYFVILTWSPVDSGDCGIQGFQPSVCYSFLASMHHLAQSACSSIVYDYSAGYNVNSWREV
jgi:hypothetical protein